MTMLEQSPELQATKFLTGQEQVRHSALDAESMFLFFSGFPLSRE
jgi:hypothetical protein